MTPAIKIIMSNPVYIKCPKCGGIRKKRRGTPKNRFYECIKCGHVAPKKGNKGRKLNPGIER